MLNRFIKVFIVTLTLVSTVIAFSASPVSAQMSLPTIDIPYALSSELNIDIVPTYPKPNETVFLNLTLYTDDLNSANITWYLDGKNVLSGKGETQYSFKNGNIGTRTQIEIVVRLLNGTSFSKNITLNPAEVDLVWEADSYVPPFYKGKALHPRQGTLKVVALPEFVKNGSRISPKNLIYEWSNGVNVYQNQSGYGKNVIVLDGSILGKSEKIEVLVTDPVNNLAAHNSITISPVNPEIVFYENSPYYGHIFDSAIMNTFILKSEEVQILAVPYYFTKENEGFWQYNWRLNSLSMQSLNESRTAVFRKPEGESGRSVISLQMENINKVLQQADNGLTIDFKNK